MTSRVWDADKERERKAAQREKKASGEAAEREQEEQALRDHYGYNASETRTRAERQAAADRIMAKAGATPMTEQQRAERRDREAELGARLVVVERRARGVEVPMVVEGERVARAISHAQWLETRLDA